jgi:hypothetical protein
LTSEESILSQLLATLASALRTALPSPDISITIEHETNVNVARGPACVIAQPALIFKEALPDHEPPALVFDTLITILIGANTASAAYPVVQTVLTTAHSCPHGLGRPGAFTLAHQTAAPLPDPATSFAAYIIRYPSGGRERFRPVPRIPPAALPIKWWHVSLETEILIPLMNESVNQ